MQKKDHRITELILDNDSFIVQNNKSNLFKLLDELQADIHLKNDHFKARFYCFKANVIYDKTVTFVYYPEKLHANLDQLKDELLALLSTAVDCAYRSEDEYLIAFTSFAYGHWLRVLGGTDVALMYLKNSIDLYEKLSYPVLPTRYQSLAEILYSVKEYSESINYAKKAANSWPRTNFIEKRHATSCFNTVALGYHRLQHYDTAIYFYNKAREVASQNLDSVWLGIISGNIGQIHFLKKDYDQALVLFKYDVAMSSEKKYYDNAANSLQWIAKTRMEQGNYKEALKEIRASFLMLKLWPDANYRRNAYHTASRIFRKTGNYDSAFYYNNLWSILNDSLEKQLAIASLNITRSRLNDERSRYQIARINREVKSQVMYRNFIIAFIALGGIIAILIINRLRIKHLHKEQLALQQKRSAEQHAREQLEALTQSLIDKTSLAEELQAKINLRSISNQKNELVNTLSNLTILTNADWEKFKSVFEQLYPGFFINLKEEIPDISIAEARMAALVKLHLSTNQVASILGISVNSVYKTKQRLRDRLKASSGKDVDEYLALI